MFNSELLVDNFAGGGGASTGIALALNRCVDHAVNHAWDALGMHRINHPKTIHHCEDVFDIDPATACEGRPVGLCHNSPDCKHFSKAKGGKPLDKKIRGLVLVMLKWAKYGARVLTMENVEEIVTWGPLTLVKKNGKEDWYADPKHKGRTWQAFLDILGTGIDPAHPDLPEILEVLGGYITKKEAVAGFGYDYETRVLRACDYGTPTIRKRLYMIARRDGRPIVWPEATHAPRDSEEAHNGTLLPYRSIAECINWDLPCPSIFLDKAAAKRWRCKRPLAASSLRRIAKGVDRYVLKSAEPFIISVTHQGGDRTEPINEPARTVTGAHRGEKALITPFVTEHANASGQRNMPADEPLRTACAQVKGGHFALVSGALVHTAHGEQDKKGKKRGRGAHAVTESMPSVLASQDMGLAAASMIKLRGDTESHGLAPDLSEPGHTISAGGTHHGIVAASIVRQFGASVGQDANAPSPTVMAGGGGKTALVAAHLTKFVTGSVGQDVRQPGPTVTAGSHAPETHGGAATPQGLVAAYLAQHNSGSRPGAPGHAATEPVSTLSATGSQQQIVAASLQKYFGTDQDPRLEEPCHTVTTKDRFGLLESTAVTPLSPEQVEGARRVAKFLRDHGVEFEGEFACVGDYVIIDLGMRMLAPRELYRAQGFPESYTIDRAWVIDPKSGSLTEINLTKEQQIRMCGNSVCPPVMQALVQANTPELAVLEEVGSTV